jgi:hypothetical protein
MGSAQWADTRASPPTSPPRRWMCLAETYWQNSRCRLLISFKRRVVPQTDYLYQQNKQQNWVWKQASWRWDWSVSTRLQPSSYPSSREPKISPRSITLQQRILVQVRQAVQEHSFNIHTKWYFRLVSVVSATFSIRTVTSRPFHLHARQGNRIFCVFGEYGDTISDLCTTFHLGTRQRTHL